MSRLGWREYLMFLLGIGPTDVVTRWDGECLMVEEKCLVTGRTLRSFVVEFERDPRC